MPKLRTSTAAVLLLAIGSCPGCLAGPHQLRRSVDDLDQALYVQNPWLNGLLWLIPAIPVLYLGAQVADSLTTDPYAFWGDDAWDCTGTGFEPADIKADYKMASMLDDQVRWFRTNRY